MIRWLLALAVCGINAMLLGHLVHSPLLMVVGLVGMLPLLVRVVRLPKVSRAGLVLSAVVFGLLLAGFAAGQHAGRPTGPASAPVAVAGVAR